MRRPYLAALGLALSIAAGASAIAPAAWADIPRRHLETALRSWRQEGMASWYGGSFFQGRLTASGMRYDQEAPMAAHRTLPFGTLVQVINLENNRRAWVVIRDRGPFVAGRVIDLSRGTAWRLGILQAGTAPVRLEVLR